MPEGSREYDVVIFGATGYTGQYVVEEFANSTKNTNIKWAVAGRDVEKVKKSLEHVQQYLEGSREYDVVIFGATGYTGQYVVEEFANSTKNTNIKWAVAGRDVEKVKKSLEHVQQYLEGVDILHIPIIEADIYDQKSILDMCKAARLIINCVGPYKLFGEPVVSACVEAATHHVDLSGELSYLEGTQANYFAGAREKGIYIVQACGFDSIPSDYGISLMKKNFPGDLNSVEYYVEIGQGPSGRKTNVGTLSSAAGSVRDFLKMSQYDRMLKEKVFTKEGIRSQYRLPKKLSPLFYSDVINSWCAWFLGPDERVIRRSQMFRYQYLNERPVEFCGYVEASPLGAFLTVFYGLLFLSFSMFSFGRSLIAKYPSFFTYGHFSKDGPTRQQVEEGSTKFTLIGEGWKYKLSEPTDQHVSQPDTNLKLTITGPEPAYPFTAMCLVHAGLVILEESDKMPLEGGVLTPGVAFENTTLSKRLEQRGMKFTFERI